MKIHYRIKNNAIEIVRCYGTDDRIVLPEEINGLPVVSAAPYAFSAHKDGEEDAETWESEDVISFGEERLLAGEEVQEIVFPDTLKEIGRYIFYGCKKLERLEFSDTLMQVGTGAFTGCSGLKELVIHQKKGIKSCAKEILGELWQKIDVDFLYENGEASGKRAHMVFPEHYDEAVENTPARILYTEYHGSGSNYRQCFYDKELNYQEYDRLFEMAVAMDKLEVLVDMSFGRLEFPYELTGKARENYREYIRKNLGDIAEYLVKQEDMHRLEVISSQKLWTLEGIDSALDCASKRKETEVSAFLMNERANLVNNTAGSERIDVDKLQNSQEADRTEQGKNEQSQTTEKSLNRRTILRKKRFEL